MSRKNQKGFLLAEALIVATFVLSVLIFLFIQFKNLSSSYDEAFKFNTVEGLYALDNVKTYLKENASENKKISAYLNSASVPYLAIYSSGSCNNSIGLRGVSFCKELMEKQNMKTVIFTKADITNDEGSKKSLKNFLKTTSLSVDQKKIFSENMREFILRVNIKELKNTYRLIAEFNDGSFATFNVGDEDWNSSKYNDPDYVDPSYNTTATSASCFTYTTSTDGATITAYSTSCTKTPKIPSELGGKRVVTIGASAFKGKSLTSVTIPAGVRSIETSAFEGNLLTSVTIPVSVLKIGDRAFYGNKIAGALVIPDNISIVGNSSFAANKITSVKFGASTASIGDAAFYNNVITKVTFNDFLYTIGNQAFASNQITSLSIPESVTSIGSYAFQNNKVTNITIPSKVTNIGNYAFSETTTWTNVEIDGEDLYRFNAKWTEIGWPLSLMVGYKTFGSSNSAQTYEVPLDGYYRVDLWGASGSASVNLNLSTTSKDVKGGGNGAYTSGVIYLTAGTKLYFYVGGAGNKSDSGAISQGGYNGGGNGSIGDTSSTDNNKARSVAGAGGGATDVRKGGTGTSNRIMVAGGGGGGSYNTVGGAGGATDAGGMTSVTGQSGSGIGAGYGKPGGGGGYRGGTSSNTVAKGGTSYIASDFSSQIKKTGTDSIPKTSLSGTETGHSGNGYVIVAYAGGSKPS